MAYDMIESPKLPVGAQAEIDLTSAAVQSFSTVLTMNGRVFRLQAKVTTATVSTGSIVLTIRRRPTFGSSSGQTTLGTLTIPTAIAVNKIYYKDITPVNCNSGDQVVVEVTTAAAGGGAAGKALFDFLMDYDPETAPNDSNFVASA